MGNDWIGLWAILPPKAGRGNSMQFNCRKTLNFLMAEVFSFLVVKDIQIEISLSVDIVHILIKILAERHMAFDLGDKIDSR